MEQNNPAECKPKMEKGKMTGNGPGILALLTAPPPSFFWRGLRPLDKNSFDSIDLTGNQITWNLKKNWENVRNFGVKDLQFIAEHFQHN